jgi:hypothetical protein
MSATFVSLTASSRTQIPGLCFVRASPELKITFVLV